MTALRLCLALAWLAACALAYPNGAASCTTPDVGAHGVMQNYVGSGYTVTFSASSYTPGGPALTVDINGTSIFRGLNIYCVDAFSQRTGSFVGSTDFNTAYRTQNNPTAGCGSNPASTYTHNVNHNPGYTADRLIWTPPSTASGNITCTTVVVKINAATQAWYQLPPVIISGPQPVGPPPPPPPPANTDLGAGTVPTATGSVKVGDMTLSYGTNASHVFITLNVPGTRWIAMGINTNDGTNMYPAEVYLGWIQGNACYFSQRANADYTGPSAIGVQQQAVLLGYVNTGGVTSITFTRPLSGSGLKTIAAGTQMAVIWAYGADGFSATNPSALASVGALNLPKHQSRGSASVDFFGSATAGSDSLRITHGTFMAVSWILFINGAIFIARFFKVSLGKKWYYIHMVLAGGASFLTAVGVIIAMMMVDGQHLYAGMSLTTVLHKVFGIFVVLGAIIQPFLGKYADIRFDPSRKSVPFFPDRTHWYLGRALAVIGTINVFLGLITYGAGAVFYVVCGLVVAIFIGLTVYKQMKGGAQHHVQDDNMELNNNNNNWNE